MTHCQKNAIGIGLYETRRHIARPIGRGIVDNQHIDRRIQLQKMLTEWGDILCLVISRENDEYGRLRSLSPWCGGI